MPFCESRNDYKTMNPYTSAKKWADELLRSIYKYLIACSMIEVRLIVRVPNSTKRHSVQIGSARFPNNELKLPAKDIRKQQISTERFKEQFSYSTFREMEAQYRKMCKWGGRRRSGAQGTYCMQHTKKTQPQGLASKNLS